jgi:hypothetical protein
MSHNLKIVNRTLKAIGSKVIVSDMHFGEQTTARGLILRDDNGTGRGIYPRWGKVYDKGPTNNDPYNIGDWILVEHGRWTRGINVNNGSGEIEVRMVENESILMWSDTKPESTMIGKEYKDGEGFTVDPSSFVNQ